MSGDLSEPYLDTPSFKLAGNRRTSLIVVPANGKLPGRVPGAKEEPPSEGKRFFDGPESFDLEERCLMTRAFGSSNATPPLIPIPFGFGSSQQWRVVERFRRTGASTLSYRVMVEDPGTWVTPWTADIPFTATDDKMFEFACHEGNYSIANALRGVRTEDKEGR